jgi:hypothetical protein
MTIFDTLRGLTGDQSDPIEDMKNYANRQQAQNRAAIGMDANGNPLPADAAAGTPQQLSPGAQATVAAHAASTLPSGQQPNATKSDPSLGATIMDLARYEQREQGFNQAMGGAFASVSQPRNRDWVKGIFNVNPLDAAKYGQTMMNVGSQQQGQDRANVIGQMVNDPTQGPLIASKLHMDWTALKTLVASDPGGAGKIAAALGTPTDAIRNLTQLGQMSGGGAGGPGGAASPELKDITSGVVSGIAGQENAPMISAQQAWRVKHPNQPDSAMPWNTGDLASFKQWQVTEAANQADRQTASAELVDKNEGAQTLKGDLLELKDSPGLRSILTTPGKRDIAISALNDPNATDVASMMKRWALNNDEAKAVALLRRIGGATTETAMRGMAGTGTRVTQMEVGPLKDAINMTQNLNQSYEDYVHGAINSAVTKTRRAIAANYGSTGNVKNMDSEYSPWLNDAFKKGGQLYKEGSGVDELAAAEPVPASEIADGKALLKDKPYLRNEMLDNWQQRGLDVSKLRGKSPSGW